MIESITAMGRRKAKPETINLALTFKFLKIIATPHFISE
jgi:hypothetical protein